MASCLDGEINLECGVLVRHPFAAGPVLCSATPGGTVATTIHHGPYDRLGEAHRAIVEWCAVRLAGPNWEIYDHWNADPAQLRTDAFFLLENDSADFEGPR